ncbi:hypothetical protein KPL70_000724 [Citrus sinensis]|nr:hypothetical protein KPL70_000724 [Citrus sinensis]
MVAASVKYVQSDIQRAIDCCKVTVSDLEKHFNVVGSINVAASNARNAIEACVVNVGNCNNVLPDYQKSGKKRKEIGDVGFDWLQFIGVLSGEKVVNSKPNRVKDNIKHENDQSQVNNSSPGDEQRFLSDDEGIGNSQFSRDSLNKFSLNQDRDTGIKLDLLDERMRVLESVGTIWKVKIPLYKSTYSENLVYRSSYNREKDENQIYSSMLREEKVNPEDDSHLTDHLRARESEISSSSSSKFIDDVMFDRYLTEANDLPKHAKECMKSGWDEERAEMILHKSARLLSQAIAMQHMSLLAVDQLGNTYLVREELKLHFSRKLRRLLLEGDVISVEEQKRILKGLDYQFMNKDKIASLLVDACEECEELLVKAGRKYRLALSIDGNDETAFDADKIFSAAIDNFDAMMLKGNIYAPDALFGWAVALQQRSRLRPRNSKEKVKLLQQARRLYQDALHMNSDNLQVREALSSCMSELNHGDFF